MAITCPVSRLEIELDGTSVDPDTARALAEEVADTDPDLAQFLRRVAEDTERLRATSEPVGAYGRRALTVGHDPADRERLDRLAHSFDDVAADREFVDAILNAKPEVRMHGVEWLDVARQMLDSPERDALLRAARGDTIDFLDAADPVLAALRDMEPPAKRPWRLTARPEQQMVADSRCGINLFMGGRGCVAPWTRIYDPTSGRHERIDVLAARGAPITVLARDASGRLVSTRTDGAPFLKGVASLYEVTLTGGRVITVTDHHRFLTPRGWRRLADVREGQLLAVAPHVPPTATASDQSAFPAGGLRSSQTAVGCSDGCPTCRRSDGRRPLPASADARDLPPSPGGVRGRIPLASPAGAPESCAGCTPACPRGSHRARSGCTPNAPSTPDGGCPPAPSGVGWQRVRSIRPAGIGLFYDMTVPVHENYVAEGFVNHNTGKGFATSNALVEWALAEAGDYAAIAPTLGDARKIVAEGPSGLLVALGDDLLNYNKSEFVLYLKNGSRIILAGAEKPDRIRGLNLRGALIDELASFGAHTLELWNEALLPALRIGKHPRICIATTPRRGNPVLKELVKRFEDGDPDVLMVRGSTKDNAANLSESFIVSIYKRYAGTRLAAQELEGKLLDEVEGALLSGDLIERNRIISAEDVPPLHRVVLGVDPAVSNTATSDHTGLVVAGIGPAPRGWTPPPGLGILADSWHLYILDDRSLRASPETWARRALTVAEEWMVDCLVAEVNQGGDLVSSQIRMVARASGMATPRITQVRASVGKAARAEPVAALFEQNRAHFVGGFPELEDEWCGWVPGSSAKSPDRLDANVWAAVQLFPELAIKAPSEVRIIA